MTNGGSGISRRYFFLGSLLAGAVPRAGYGSAVALKSLGYKSPNEKLNIAAIGAGGRAEANLVAGAMTENIVALADPDSKRAEKSFQLYDKATKYADFRKMLDKEAKNIDAVFITTPDHMHATIAIWCMERGKHVYVEKPLTRTVWEARLLADAAAKYKVATQMGNQGYSNDGARLAAEIVWSGEIGNVTEVHAWTNRPVWPQGLQALPPEASVPGTLDWDLWLGGAAMRPYSPEYLPFNWRGFFDFGSGSLGDMACHILGAPNMALQLGAPASVEVTHQEGKNPHSFPTKSTTRFEFPARGAMPPVKVFWYDGARGPAYRPPGIPEDEPLIGGLDSFGSAGGASLDGLPIPTLEQLNRVTPIGGGPGSNGAVWVGEKGFLTTDTYGANVRLLPLARHQEYKLPLRFLTRAPEHHRDWIRACKGGERSCSDFSVAGPFTEWIQLASIALHVEGKLDWDSARMRFTNSAEATKYVKPTFRKGWEIKL
jgi:predicted dehydrogenase